MTDQNRPHWLEISPFDIDGGHAIGRDPRLIKSDQWGGKRRLTGLQAIRAKCLDCAHSAAEVRKCVCFDCPLWPYRMGSVPAGLRQASSLDAIPARPHTGPNPATAPVLSDAAQPKLPRNSRAASAHRKDKHNG